MRRAAIIFLIAIGAIRIAATYTTFSETADEPMHLSAGLEILTHHTYSIQLQNPPLPRVLIALPPWLSGARYQEPPDKFHANGHYKTMLVLARAPTLIFFIIGALATWAWARRETDETTALVALFFFTTQPSILGHSGLATLDTAGTAGLAVSLLAFSRWLEKPDLKRAAILGIAWGFAISCKLLCIAYVPLACAAIFIVRRQWRKVATVLIVPPIAALIVWAGYGFHADPFLRGVAEMMEVNRAGFMSYAMRRWSTEGWWWYFPLALALKTTIASLVIVLAGFTFKNRRFLEAFAAAIAILAFSMTTHVNIGVRYILPIYVPLSLAAAIAITRFAASRKLRVASFVLVAWHLIASVAAHPDYLAYFNEFGGRDPSRYLLDSNLDWGQDVLRLRDEVRRLEIPQLGLAVFGPADPAQMGFPPHYNAHPWAPPHGWIAVSDHAYRIGAWTGGWSWLKRDRCRRIGKSIRLCHFD